MVQGWGGIVSPLPHTLMVTEGRTGSITPPSTHVSLYTAMWYGLWLGKTHLQERQDVDERLPRARGRADDRVAHQLGLWWAWEWGVGVGRGG